MLEIRCQTRFETKTVVSKVQRANIENLGHAGAAIRLTARRSIRRSKRYAAEGSPPHTRRGQLKGAIAYAVERREEQVVIGPEASKVGASGSAHEYGGKYKRQRYAKRPFMGPALTKMQPRLPKVWAGSVRS